jgi:hypothetical protein
VLDNLSTGDAPPPPPEEAERFLAGQPTALIASDVADRVETELDAHKADAQLRPRWKTRWNDTVVSPLISPA